MNHRGPMSFAVCTIFALSSNLFDRQRVLIFTLVFILCFYLSIVNLYFEMLSSQKSS